VLTFEVRGTPVPQGSIRSLGRGRPSVHGNAERLLPWRESVLWAARDALGGAAPIVGAAEVSLTFYLAKPKSTPKKAVWPVKRPDLDKLTRAVLDALTAAGVWLDDSQVTALSAQKVWTQEAPGVFVRVGAIGQEWPEGKTS
jgi:crossover junction endodeoxyribonuclease RusA